MSQRRTLSRSVRILALAGSLGVWLTPLGAQFDPNAKVLAESGQVSVLQDGYQTPVFVGTTVIKPRQVIVTGPDGYVKLQTSDGSTFEVFPNAKITFRDSYPNVGDLIQVFMGKIRVMIDHHKGPNPNRVSTPTAVISVRGTVFWVDDEDQDDTTLVTVEEGLVEVRHARFPDNSKLLHENESIRVFKDQPIAKVTDHNGIFRAALEHFKQAVYDWAYTRPDLAGKAPAGGIGSIPGGAQGDTKPGAGTGSGTKAPGNPPAPGAPPPPGGGGE
jgi:hypothetical protein